MLSLLSLLIFFTFFLLNSYARCPDGTLSYRFWCYKVVEANATFKEAISECHKLGGDLAPIEAKEELEFLKLDKDIEKGYWIGGMHLGSSYNWLASGACDQNVMKTFLKRYLYEDPDQLWCLNLQYRCHFCGKEAYYEKSDVENSKGWYLYDSYCNETRSYVCLAPQERGLCSIGWSYSNSTGKCYKFFPINIHSLQANEICDFENSHLASIHNSSENDFLGDLLQNTQSAWIGLSFNYSSENDQNSISLTWDDGTDVDFMPWKAFMSGRNKRSMEMGEDKSCFTLHKMKKRVSWNEEDCGNYAQGVICMKNTKDEDDHENEGVVEPISFNITIA